MLCVVLKFKHFSFQIYLTKNKVSITGIRTGACSTTDLKIHCIPHHLERKQCKRQTEKENLSCFLAFGLSTMSSFARLVSLCFFWTRLSQVFQTKVSQLLTAGCWVWSPFNFYKTRSPRLQFCWETFREESVFSSSEEVGKEVSLGCLWVSFGCFENFSQLDVTCYCFCRIYH